MKLFLRGLMALAFVAVLSLTASAGDKGGDCGCNGAAGAKKARFGHRLTEANEHIGGCLAKLAGPQVEPTAGSAFGKKGGPHTQPGTVVFPQHPFARSPRDFFMDP